MRKQVCFTNGCFDILHEGHLKLLRLCKDLGQVIVALNSDESITKLKGISRPVNDENTRILNLKNTGLVDEVLVFFDEAELESLISQINPDYLVKGSDYKGKEITGANIVKKNGGEILYVDLVPGLSTSKLTELQEKSFLITGAMGFIGSNVIEYLNKLGITKISCVDKFDTSEKWKNFLDKEYLELISYEDFKTIIFNPDLQESIQNFDYIIHLGANSNTQETDFNNLYEDNIKFTNKLIDLATFYSVKLIYASSAATYGSEETNFVERVKDIKPINKYGFSKLVSDKYLISSLESLNSLLPFKIYGFRFFNVYGNYESHKIGMISGVSKFIEQERLFKEKQNQTSVFNNDIFESYPFKQLKNEIKINVQVDSTKQDAFKLFESYKEGIENGEQKRDFIHVSDICKVILHFVLNEIESGIYNVGTGIPRTFKDICKIINSTREIEYIPMPESLKPIYQYYTCADLTKLRDIAGYNEPFLTLEEGIKLYDL